MGRFIPSRGQVRQLYERGIEELECAKKSLVEMGVQLQAALATCEELKVKLAAVQVERSNLETRAVLAEEAVKLAKEALVEKPAPAPSVTFIPVETPTAVPVEPPTVPQSPVEIPTVPQSP